MEKNLKCSNKPLLVKSVKVRKAKNNILKIPYVQSYELKIDPMRIDSILKIHEVILDFMNKLSRDFSYEGIIAGHIKGVLFTDHTISDYSTTIENDTQTNLRDEKASISSDLTFGMDILTYVKPGKEFMAHIALLNKIGRLETKG